jgi:hypothetical protein
MTTFEQKRKGLRQIMLAETAFGEDLIRSEIESFPNMIRCPK